MTTENKYWEYTQEEIYHLGYRLRRIRALIDLPDRRVKKGETGGWVSDSAEVSGSAWVYDEARVYGSARVSGSAEVSGSAWVSGSARVYGSARVERKAHIITLTSIGSEGVIVNLVRTKDGHYLKVGCWEGTVQTLMKEVYRRSENWVCDGDTKQQWIEEYQALEMLASKRVAAWERSREQEGEKND